MKPGVGAKIGYASRFRWICKGCCRLTASKELHNVETPTLYDGLSQSKSPRAFGCTESSLTLPVTGHSPAHTPTSIGHAGFYRGWFYHCLLVHSAAQSQFNLTAAHTPPSIELSATSPVSLSYQPLLKPHRLPVIGFYRTFGCTELSRTPSKSPSYQLSIGVLGAALCVLRVFIERVKNICIYISLSSGYMEMTFFGRWPVSPHTKDMKLGDDTTSRKLPPTL
ncbi:hypothetical protein BDQ17DRAFT_1420015 [Cyathus striatus]|nr:hypothetical protein BDQ17DRAFT_1420015 [Cyathus striatus]